MSLSPREVVDACPVAGLLVSASGRQLHANGAWEGLVGAAADDWLGQVHPDDRAIAERLARQRSVGQELRVASNSGWKWTLASSHPCDEGATLWFQEVGSERDDVLRSLERERELNALKNRFISVVSHEFRTPLTVILSSAELLEHYGAKWPDERRIQHLRKIHTAVVVMTALLDNVGLYGRVESGSLENNPEPFDASAMLAEILDDVRMAMPVEQELSLDDRAEGRRLLADPKLLRHVFANLLANAIRFSNHGTPIETSCFWEGDNWVVEVRDRGIGVPPRDAERVWERFQRGSNVDGIPGTGLGLAIVRRCAEIMGAKATLSDRDGSGTVARVELASGSAATPRREGNP